jgi:hypothetical protein
MSLPSDAIDYTGPGLSLELWDALGRPAALPPGLYWVEGKTAAWEDGDGWELALFADPPSLAGGSPRRAFSCSELTLMLPGQIETPQRTYCGIMIWGEGVYELRYESAYIKGDRPEPYVSKWSHIFPRPIQQPTEILVKARMLLYLLEKDYLTPAAALQRLGRIPRGDSLCR